MPFNVSGRPRWRAHGLSRKGRACSTRRASVVTCPRVRRPRPVRHLRVASNGRRASVVPDQAGACGSGSICWWAERLACLARAVRAGDIRCAPSPSPSAPRRPRRRRASSKRVQRLPLPRSSRRSRARSRDGLRTLVRAVASPSNSSEGARPARRPRRRLSHASARAAPPRRLPLRRPRAATRARIPPPFSAGPEVPLPRAYQHESQTLALAGRTPLRADPPSPAPAPRAIRAAAARAPSTRAPGAATPSAPARLRTLKRLVEFGPATLGSRRSCARAPKYSSNSSTDSDVPRSRSRPA